MSVRTGVTRVQPTEAELEAFHRKYGPNEQPRVWRVRCDLDGTRYWGSGLAIGSHRRGRIHNEAADAAYLSARSTE